MNTTYRNSRSTSDLAATLTDVAFEVAARRGTSGNSVETELTLWHTLHAELDREARALRLGAHHNERTPLDGELRAVVCRAVMRVANAGE